MSVRSDIAIEDPRWSGALDVHALSDRVIYAALSALESDVGEAAEVSLLFSDDARISVLKGAWLGKNVPTNVLSFPAAESGQPHGEGERFLGDIIFSFDTISREAEAEGKTLEAHLSHMIAHGFLHLMGFDHIEDEEAAEMEGLESRIMVALGMPDPWADERGDGA